MAMRWAQSYNESDMALIVQVGARISIRNPAARWGADLRGSGPNAIVKLCTSFRLPISREIRTDGSIARATAEQ